MTMVVEVVALEVAVVTLEMVTHLWNTRLEDAKDGSCMNDSSTRTLLPEVACAQVA